MIPFDMNISPAGLQQRNYFVASIFRIKRIITMMMMMRMMKKVEDSVLQNVALTFISFFLFFFIADK